MTDGVGAREPERFDAVTILVHWLTLAMVIAQFATAWLHGQASGGGQAAQVLLIHRSDGVLLWVLTLARLAWRATHGRKVPLPRATPRIQRLMARANEYALYGLLVVQPLTGLAQSVLRGKAFPLLFGDVPALTARHRELVRLVEAIHEKGAVLLLALIALHAGAALIHHFILRDGVLRAMLPKFSGAAGNKSGPPPVLSLESRQNGSHDDD